MKLKSTVLAIFMRFVVIGLTIGSGGKATGQPMEVDAQLVLAVDVSRSMSAGELEIQRRGYAAALASDEVIAAITGGMLGRVAILYVEWAANSSHRVVVDWSAIGSRRQALEFAEKLTASFDNSMRRTSISGALDYSAAQIETNGFTSFRKIIDVSGDGPNNQGRPVLMARAATLAKGITINGLPLMTREGLGGWFHLDDLDEYYKHCVIGGPGSFVIPVNDWQQFPAAVRQKLVLELAGPARLPVTKAAFSKLAEGSYNCLIGEQIWEERQLYWGDN